LSKTGQILIKTQCILHMLVQNHHIHNLCLLNWLTLDLGRVLQPSSCCCVCRRDHRAHLLNAASPPGSQSLLNVMINCSRCYVRRRPLSACSPSIDVVCAGETIERIFTFQPPIPGPQNLSLTARTLAGRTFTLPATAVGVQPLLRLSHNKVWLENEPSVGALSLLQLFYSNNKMAWKHASSPYQPQQ
jgi:hypothetical protein